MRASPPSRRLARCAALAALLGVPGCQRVLGLAPLSARSPDAAAPDALPPDAAACVMPAKFDAFDTAPPCASWGSVDPGPATAPSSVTVANGQLVIVPPPNIASDATRGGCVTATPMPFTRDAGVFAQVTSAPDGDEYMLLEIGDGGTQWSLAWSNGAITFGNGTMKLGSTGFVAGAPAWARMRPSADGSAIVAETSPDGRVWTQFAEDPLGAGGAPIQVVPDLEAGTFRSDPAPAAIRYDGFDVCP